MFYSVLLAYIRSRALSNVTTNILYTHFQYILLDRKSNFILSYLTLDFYINVYLQFGDTCLRV